MFQPDSSSASDAMAIEFPEIKVRRTALPNGLTLLTKCDRSAPVASVQAWCSVGSIHEDEWLGAGLSHILEHMLFKGTETRTTGEIAETVQDSGGYMNAYTSFDRTVYWIDCPSEGDCPGKGNWPRAACKHRKSDKQHTLSTARQTSHNKHLTKEENSGPGEDGG